MRKKISIMLVLVLCLVMNSVVAFAAEDTSTSDNVIVVDFAEQTVTRSGEFAGSFSGGTCTITGIPDYGGNNIIFLRNVPGKNINCKISGNPNMHYRLEYLYSGFPATTYVSGGVLGNGSTTPTTKLGYTGNYYVTVFAYSGSTNAQKLTLKFTSW